MTAGIVMAVPTVLVYALLLRITRNNILYEDWLRKNNIEERLFTAAELRVLNENLLCEMAVIWPRDSGIPYKLWLDPVGIAKSNEHTFSPRVKMEGCRC